MPPIPDLPNERLFLTGGGEMGERIRNHDWASTPLGQPEHWSQPLQTLVGLMLSSVQPMFIAWGEQHTLLYNDAYKDILGNKHPAALGERFLDVWTEIRTDLVPIVEQASAGHPVHMDDIMLMMERRGYREETHFAFSYTPIREADGRVGGFFCPCTETTNQVLAERRRMEESERQRRLFEQAPGFITILRGPQHVYEFVNQTYRRFFGDRDYLGQPAAEVFPELLEQGFIEQLDRTFQSGQRYVAENALLKFRHPPDNAPEERFINFIFEPVIDEYGTVTGIFIEGQDVTDRHRAEEALRASESQFSALTQAIPIIVWTANVKGTVDWFNERSYQYTNTHEGELTHGGWTAFAHPDDLPALALRWAQAVATGTPYQGELRIRRHDGGYRWHLARAIPVYAENGELLRWIGTNTDIHDQKLATQALRQMNEQLEQLVAERTAERDTVWRNSRDILLVIGRDGTLRGVNPAWTEILGHPQAAVENQSFRNFVWPEDARRAEHAFQCAVAGHDLIGFENRFVHQEGTPRWISWNTSSEGDVVYAYGRHISAEKQQAEALRQAEDQLRQAQKMEAVGQLTGGIAHDFNNLLTGIIGSLERMQSHLTAGRSADIQRYTEGAMSSAQRAAALTHRLLAFARRQPLDPRRVDVRELILGMEELLRRTLGPKYELELVNGDGQWVTRCDPYQLESSLLNIAINARDAMPAGGKLRIETCETRQPLSRSPGDMPVAAGDFLSICISDTGTGMSPELIERAVEPFFTTKPQGQGTGLGLSMVYGFARQSEGYLKIESQLGEGSRICIHLPRYLGDAEPPEVAELSTSAPQTVAPLMTSETVLLVEDEPLIRELVCEVLTELGFKVLQAPDGLAGLEMLQDERAIDLLITDIGLPGMDGRELAEYAAASRPGLKVLLITGYAKNATLATGFMGPGMELMTKPFSIEALTDKVVSLFSDS